MSTTQPRFSNLVDLFQFAIEQYGDRDAYGTLVGQDWQWTSYRQLASFVDHCRAGLAQLGVGRNDRVAIISDNRIEWVITAHATYGRRAIVVPMYEAQGEADWSYILGDVGAKVCLVANRAIAQRVDALREDLLDLQHIITFDGEASEPDSFAALLTRGAQRDIKVRQAIDKDIATIIYTSGTTGEPKGVRLTHTNLASQACLLADNRDYGEDPRSMAFLGWAHVFGGGVELNVGLLIGSAVAICKNTDQLYSEMPRVQPTMLYAVPRVWTQIYYNVQRDLSEEPDLSRRIFENGVHLRGKLARGESLTLSERMIANVARRIVGAKLKGRLGGRLRLAFSGAASLPMEVATFMASVGVPIHEGYGLTECSGSTSTNPSGAVRLGTVGRPLPGTRVDIDDSVVDEDDVEHAGHGEVIIHGPGVMAGYHNKPEATAEVLMADGGLRTGDIGFIDEDGYLHITGRIKELYKLNNGRYVAPAPLEAKLKLSPFIEQCLVYGAGQARNVALIVVDVPALQSYLGDVSRTPQELVADPRTRRLLEEEILKYSRDFKTFELIHNFWLETEELGLEHGMMTQTMKLKRQRVLRKYEGRLLSLY